MSEGKAGAYVQGQQAIENFSIANGIIILMFIISKLNFDMHHSSKMNTVLPIILSLATAIRLLCRRNPHGGEVKKKICCMKKVIIQKGSCLL